MEVETNEANEESELLPKKNTKKSESNKISSSNEN